MRKPKNEAEAQDEAGRGQAVQGDRHRQDQARHQAMKRHILTKKAPGRKRALAQGRARVGRRRRAGEEDAAGLEWPFGRAREPRPAPAGAEPQASQVGQRSSCPGRVAAWKRDGTGRWWPGPDEGTSVMPRVKRGSKRREQAQEAAVAGPRATSSARASSTSSPRRRSTARATSPTSGRKRKKRDFRRLWIIRINAAARLHEMSYSQFMAGLKRRRDRPRPQVARRDRGDATPRPSASSSSRPRRPAERLTAVAARVPAGPARRSPHRAMADDHADQLRETAQRAARGVRGRGRRRRSRTRPPCRRCATASWAASRARCRPC